MDIMDVIASKIGDNRNLIGRHALIDFFLTLTELSLFARL
jgi:hypothetical protein